MPGFKRQFGNRKGAGKKPELSVALSVKQGNGYVKGPSFGLWTNEEGGPAYRGTLKGDYLNQVVEFLANAAEADLSVGLAVFDNEEKPGNRAGKPWNDGFKQPAKKANPFKKQEPQEQEEDAEDAPF
jgi:hypothetical protein